MNRQKGVTNHTFCIDRDNRVASNETMKLLVDLHLDAKMPTRRIRHLDPRHLSSIHACYLHLRTLGYAIKIGEFGVQQHVTRESLMTTSDEEDPESEQRYTGDDEDSYSKISSGH
jgi:hypothetical protein